MELERIKVDPAQVDVLKDDFGEEVATELGDSSDWHQTDWVARACEQIRTQRFALIMLPQKYARMYQMLLQAGSYPRVVSDGQAIAENMKTATTNLHLVPADLLSVSKSWANVCENICKVVTRRLEELVAPSGSRPHTCCRDQCHGMLRVSYNSSAGQHYDNSFVTFMGTGNTRGALQFGNVPCMLAREEECNGADDLSDRFSPCEDILSRDAGSEEDVTFFMFAGGRIASPLSSEYKPLLHRVLYEGIDGTTPRINVMYFLRQYAASEKKSSKLDLEIHAFNRTVVSQREFVCDVPAPASDAETETVEPDVSELSTPNSVGRGIVHGDSEAHTFVFDWSYDGAPTDLQ